jgi:ABC-type transport system involved in cytochrome c biogenesis permease subunit
VNLLAAAWDPRLHVVALSAYALAAGCAILAGILGRPRLATASWVAAFGGMTVHAAGLLSRWYATGHGPYVSRYEVLSANALVALAAFALAARAEPRLRPLATVVFPAAMLLVGIGLYAGPEVRTLPPTFSGVWLVLHVCFYFVAFGAALITVALAVGTLIGDRFPALALSSAEADLLSYRAAGMTFVFWGIGMLTGSVWAYYAWGRFWGWDPIETWALVTWLALGVYLHLRRFFHWEGRKAALLFAVCFVLAVSTLFLSSFILGSSHAAYFR